MKLLVTLAAAALCFTAPSSQASGSAAPRMPKTGGSKGSSNMNDALYAAGQKVYEGKAIGTGSASAQTARLGKVASMVTDDNKAAMLRQLAGKISNEQLSALEYFVASRFKK